MNRFKGISLSLLISFGLAFALALPAITTPAQASWSLFGEADPVTHLLAFKYRPTPRDVLAAFGGKLPEENPFMDSDDNLTCEETHQNYTLETIRAQMNLWAYAPLAIATMEKAYPGASYFPAGRDGALFGDMLEYFYDLQGQHDRVYRLYASGPTVRGLDKNTGEDFLESNGLGRRPQYPVLFIDNTSWNNNSQTYLLTTYAASYFKKRGFTNQQLKHSLTTASIHAKSGWHVNRSELTNAAARESYYLKSPLLIPPALYPLFYQGGFWHPSLDKKVKILRSGQQAGKISSDRFKESTRRIALSFMYESMKVVGEPSFLERVQREAESLDFKFEFKPVDPIPFQIMSKRDLFDRNFQENKDYFLGELKRLISIQLSSAPIHAIFKPEHVDNLFTKSELENYLKKAFDFSFKQGRTNVAVKDISETLSLKGLNLKSGSIGRFRFIIKNLKPVLTQDGFYSKNGQILHDWISSAVKGMSAPHFYLQQITYAYHKRRLTNLDFKRLTRLMFSKTMPPITKNFIDEIAINHDLKQMLEENADLFVTNGYVNATETYIYNLLVKRKIITPSENPPAIDPNDNTLSKSECSRLLGWKAYLPERWRPK